VFLDKNEEWNVKSTMLKIVLEEHDLATGNMICTKRNENCT
jgi:methionyl-tRNA formyltransferase